MTREDKIQAIVTALADSANVLVLMRVAITNALPNVEDPRLDVLMAALGIPQT